MILSFVILIRRFLFYTKINNNLGTILKTKI